jgi:uncharacterized protein with GYD domain
MATFVTLFNLTPQGIQNIRESPNRLEAAKKLVRSCGGEMKAFYFVMGHYDAVVISEAPDDETAAKAALALGAFGNVRSETMRAFGEEEYKKIIGGIPRGT